MNVVVVRINQRGSDMDSFPGLLGPAVRLPPRFASPVLRATECDDDGTEGDPIILEPETDWVRITNADSIRSLTRDEYCGLTCFRLARTTLPQSI